MANAAVAKDGSIVDSYRLTEEEFLTLQVELKKKQNHFIGLWCKHPMFPRRGNKTTRQHFAHYAETAECQYNTKGESDQHRALKFTLQEEGAKLGYESIVENRISNKAISDVSIVSSLKHLILEVQLATQSHASYAIRTQHRNAENAETIWLTTEPKNLNIPNVATVLMTGVDSRSYEVLDEVTYVHEAKDLDEFIANVRTNVRFELYDKETEAVQVLTVSELVSELMSVDSKFTTKGIIEQAKREAIQARLEEARKARASVSKSRYGSNYVGGNEEVNFRTHLDSMKRTIRDEDDRRRASSVVTTPSIIQHTPAAGATSEAAATSVNKVAVLEMDKAEQYDTVDTVDISTLPDVMSFTYTPHMYRNYNNANERNDEMYEGFHLRLREATPSEAVPSELESAANKKNCGHALKNNTVNHNRLYSEDAYVAHFAIKAIQAIHGDKWCHKADRDIFQYMALDAAGNHLSLFDMLVNGYFEQVRD